jgi:alpha-tubulin suppressor-like RCC1 family protein
MTTPYTWQVAGELEGKKVVAVDSGYVLWIAATADGGVFTCDTQDDGYAGTLKAAREPNAAGELGREGSPFVPGQVLGALQGKVVTAVAAGREHALVATADGEVYSWGGRGALLVGRSGDHHGPGLLHGALEGDKVLFVAGGEVSERGQRYFPSWDLARALDNANRKTLTINH